MPKDELSPGIKFGHRVLDDLCKHFRRAYLPADAADCQEKSQRTVFCLPLRSSVCSYLGLAGLIPGRRRYSPANCQVVHLIQFSTVVNGNVQADARRQLNQSLDANSDRRTF